MNYVVVFVVLKLDELDTRGVNTHQLSCVSALDDAVDGVEDCVSVNKTSSGAFLVLRPNILHVLESLESLVSALCLVACPIGIGVARGQLTDVKLRTAQRFTGPAISIAFRLACHPRAHQSVLLSEELADEAMDHAEAWNTGFFGERANGRVKRTELRFRQITDPLFQQCPCRHVGSEVRPEVVNCALVYWDVERFSESSPAEQISIIEALSHALSYALADCGLSVQVDDFIHYHDGGDGGHLVLVDRRATAAVVIAFSIARRAKGMGVNIRTAVEYGSMLARPGEGPPVGRALFAAEALSRVTEVGNWSLSERYRHAYEPSLQGHPLGPPEQDAPAHLNARDAFLRSVFEAIFDLQEQEFDWTSSTPASGSLVGALDFECKCFTRRSYTHGRPAASCHIRWISDPENLSQSQLLSNLEGLKSACSIGLDNVVLLVPKDDVPSGVRALEREMERDQKRFLVWTRRSKEFRPLLDLLERFGDGIGNVEQRGFDALIRDADFKDALTNARDTVLRALEPPICTLEGILPIGWTRALREPLDGGADSLLGALAPSRRRPAQFPTPADLANISYECPHEGTPRNVLRRVYSWVRAQETPYNLLVVSGGPGSGKSFLALTVGLGVARAYLQDPQTWRIPIAVRLNGMLRLIQTTDGASLRELQGENELDRALCSAAPADVTTSDLQAMSSRLLIILDGLDEMGLASDGDFLEVALAAVKCLKSRYEHAKVLLTCRSELFLTSDDEDDVSEIADPGGVRLRVIPKGLIEKSSLLMWPRELRSTELGIFLAKCDRNPLALRILRDTLSSHSHEPDPEVFVKRWFKRELAKHNVGGLGPNDREALFNFVDMAMKRIGEEIARRGLIGPGELRDLVAKFDRADLERFGRFLAAPTDGRRFATRLPLVQERGGLRFVDEVMTDHYCPVDGEQPE
ncbi:MAG: hypothetical protein AAF682_28045 [Planctomycetota bacterium]